MKSEGFYQHEPFAGFVGNEYGLNVIFYFGGHTRRDALDLANAEVGRKDRRFFWVPLAKVLMPCLQQFGLVLDHEPFNFV